jgi:deoxyribose-phosphate aldolase
MADSGAVRRIALGADHGGFELKEALKSYLGPRGYAIEDCGTHSSEPVDYPVYAHAVAQLVSQGKADRGIMVDRAGIGSAMAANKVPGVRAALCYDLSTARNSREHNDANVLTLGAGLVGPDLAKQIVDIWLATECTAERHLRRVAMIEPAGAATVAPARDSGTASAGSREQQVENLTETDIQRVIRRIAELSGAPAAKAAGSASYSDLTYVFPQNPRPADPDSLRRLVGAGADRVAHLPGAGVLPKELAAYIDHTLLKPDATAKQILDLCDEAEQYGFATVCINPSFVRLAAERLKRTHVKVCTVAGFPLGAHVPEVKALEARRAVREGAREVDMVINIGALKGGDDQLVYRDIRLVVEACMDGGAICKVIIEAALLTDEEKVRACQAARRARADFVKTSTGFGPGGATAHDVALMAEAVKGTRMGVKAAGGIRTFQDAAKMIQAGATRLGASASVRIMKEAKGLTVSESTAA